MDALAEKLIRLGLAGLSCLVICASINDSRAQEIPCPLCGDIEYFEHPESGWWYNRSEPGTGINMEMQAGLLLGSYYTFDSEGNAQWYIFHGLLAPHEGPDYSLVVEATLERYVGGSCLGCEYQAPSMVDDTGTIRLEFDQRNHAKVSINGAEQFSIVPLLAGVAFAFDFEETLDYAFPELEGPWVFVFNNPAVAGKWGQSSVVLNFNEKGIRVDSEGRTELLRYGMYEYLTHPEIQAPGGLVCESGLDVSSGQRLLPECEISLFMHYPGLTQAGRIDFPIPFANIGDSRISTIDPVTGIRLDAYRLNYD